MDESLVAASMASASWNRHSSALRSYKKFAILTGQISSMPFTIESVRKYTTWALKNQKLGLDTVKVYLSDFKLAHKLRNLPTHFENDFFIKLMLKGAKNLSLYNDICKPAKFVMSYHLLMILGHEIAKSNWETDSKNVFWTACCVAFFGSFRLGEILSTHEEGGKVETLKWNQVQFTTKNSAILNIKFPKIVKNVKGDFVDLFKIENCTCCPFSALRKLANSHQDLVTTNHPVFSFKNGSLLTTKKFTEKVQKLLYQHIGQAAFQISGHSFRAGIPAALANNPDLASDHEIMIWGRWSSETYKVYTRLKHEAKFSIFQKIISMYKTK